MAWQGYIISGGATRREQFQRKEQMNDEESKQQQPRRLPLWRLQLTLAWPSCVKFAT
jgi:hypothetical protein